ncbi:TonB-dependent receptor [Sphingomonadales bacterium 56]|nr:TonB-dependent receptor [Sphingomonadales bacterium 56]MBY2960124.1 TonB-dependent receptor [Sphingomonadales bacterium 58]CAD7340005.1 Vitamin B12 transporter BtuB [Sphingobium sp. S6]CAD7340419.1 Vitamin B12 transporter BtuB [Sphingobium sp. S8]
MRMKRATRAALLCAGVSAFAVPALAYAQAGSENSTSDIVVTATRRAENLKDVAMSVNVATGEQLEKFNIFDVKDVQQLAPGLELTNTTGRNNTTTLRGITFDPDQGTDPAVQLYYNEIPTDAQTAFTAIYDIEQIEVLRGPQGLLRGISAPAGSITIRTRRPNFDQIEGYGQATATDRGGYNVQLGTTLPFNENLSLRVAGLVDGNRINHVYNIPRDKRSYGQTQSARVTLGWRPTENLTTYLTYQYLQADNNQYTQSFGPGNTPFSAVPVATLAGIFIPDTTVRSGPPLSATDYASVQEGGFRTRNRTHLINLAADLDLGWSTLSFVGAHQYSKLQTNRDLDTTNAIPGYIQYSNVVTPYKVDTGELRLQSNNDEGLGWGVGAFYSRQTGTTTVNQDASQFWYAAAPGSFNPVPGCILDPTAPCDTLTPFPIPNTLAIRTLVDVPVNVKTASFSANLRYKGGGLTVEGGLRYTIRKQVDSTILTLVGDVNSGPEEIIPASLRRSTDKPLTGGLSVNYALTDDLNVYAAYGHSFRSGSTGVSVPAGVSNDLIRTDPEKTDSYEVGLKGSVFDRKVNFTVAAFYQKFDGFLSRFTGIFYNCPDFGDGTCALGAPPIDNATDVPATNGGFDFNYNAPAKVKGIEVTIDARPTPNWDLNIAASYARARFSNALVPCNDFAGTGTPNQDGTPRITGTGNVSFCRTNGRLAETPDFGLTANTELRFPMGDYTPFIRGLLAYRPGFYSERVQYDYRSREQINLFVGLRGPESKWELTGFVRNLLNQKRISNIAGGEGQVNALLGSTFNSGYRSVNVTVPREFGITANVKW